jgi:hypothetical protein
VAATELQFPEVKELWSPSASTLPVLQSFGYTKSSTMNSSDVRQAVTKYVKTNGLINEANKSVVVLDPILCRMLSSKGAPPLSQLKWDELMKKFFEKMTPCYQITIPGRGTHQRYFMAELCFIDLLIPLTVTALYQYVIVIQDMVLNS